MPVFTVACVYVTDNTAESQEAEVSSIDVVLYGLGIIIPLMTPDLLRVTHSFTMPCDQLFNCLYMFLVSCQTNLFNLFYSFYDYYFCYDFKDVCSQSFFPSTTLTTPTPDLLRVIHRFTSVF